MIDISPGTEVRVPLRVDGRSFARLCSRFLPTELRSSISNWCEGNMCWLPPEGRDMKGTTLSPAWEPRLQPVFLFDGPGDAEVTVLLAHGAGAPMDSASMTAATGALAAAGLRVVRFEFDYMAARRGSSSRKPPPKAELLIPEYRRAVEALPVEGRLVIGGKSMGGRVASMLADSLHAECAIAGLLCLGYPFHPPGKPTQLRTAHLETLKTPALICQGTRDEFGTSDEVGAYTLSPSISLLWLEDGDHDLKPRKSISGYTAAQHLARMAEEARDWIGRLPPKNTDR